MGNRSDNYRLSSLVDPVVVGVVSNGLTRIPNTVSIYVDKPEVRIDS